MFYLLSPLALIYIINTISLTITLKGCPPSISLSQYVEIPLVDESEEELGEGQYESVGKSQSKGVQ